MLFIKTRKTVLGGVYLKIYFLCYKGFGTARLFFYVSFIFVTNKSQNEYYITQGGELCVLRETKGNRGDCSVIYAGGVFGVFSSHIRACIYRRGAFNNT